MRSPCFLRLPCALPALPTPPLPAPVLEAPALALAARAAAMDLMAVPKKKVSKYKKGLRNGPKALKPIPVIVRCRLQVLRPCEAPPLLLLQRGTREP
ncbi:hypothetical protein PVAP13_9NG313200 [Panicum virgatum]|uniref:Large ribosomal subunit protein bL32m n=1 Tax=Panicum virgatum TaxID=38727 RepID=A0A8T0MNA2_PANVG|nr:hypothetical protein PVAP13_9NG313200 [Panicum virgatum]